MYVDDEKELRLLQAELNRYEDQLYKLNFCSEADARMIIGVSYKGIADYVESTARRIKWIKEEIKYLEEKEK